MKKIIYLTFLFLCTVSIDKVHSQNPVIKNGPEFKSEEGPKFDNFLGKDEIGVYSLLYKQKATSVGYYIEKTDLKTLNPIYTIPYEGDISQIYLVKDKILSFTKTYNKSEQMVYFLMEEIDTRTGKSIGDKKNVASLASDPLGVDGRNFHVTFSPDKTKMAIINELKWPQKESEVETSIYETGTYKKLSTKKLISSYGKSNVSTSNYKLTNSGNFYYLFSYTSNFEEGINNIGLGYIQNDITKSVITPFPFDKMEMKNGNFEFINNNLIFCGAFKDIASKEGQPKAGFYKFLIDEKNGEIKNKSFDYFTEDVNAKLTYKDNDVPENPSDKNYEFKKVISINEDLYLIESQAYGVRVYTTNSLKDFFTEREYIITKYNNKGQMQWMKVIPKFTVNLNNFNFVVKNNKIYMVYIDHPNNLKDIDINNYKPKKVEKVKNIDESVIVYATIDENGNISRNELFKNNELFYSPGSENIILNNTELLIRLSRGKKTRFDKISIN